MTGITWMCLLQGVLFVGWSGDATRFVNTLFSSQKESEWLFSSSDAGGWHFAPSGLRAFNEKGSDSSVEYLLRFSD